MKTFIRQCFVTASVNSNVIALGCAFGYPAILLPQLKEIFSPTELSKATESWIVSVFALSLLIGNFITPIIMEKLGRRATHFTVTLLTIIGWLTIILAADVKMIIIGRIFNGLSGGILIILRSILIGEYTSPKNRGAFLTSISVSQSFGVFFVHLLGSLLSWQRTALVCVFFTFASLVMILYTPESPSWLLAKGREEEFRKAFQYLRGDDENEELEKMVKARLVAAQVDKKQGNFANILKTVKKNEFYKPIIIVFQCNTMMHLAGGTVMSAYATVIISLLMGPNTSSYFWMVFLDILRIFTGFMAMYLIRKLKRRQMVLYASVLCILSQIALGIYSYWSSHDSSLLNYLWIPIILINLQMFSVAIGMIPMPAVIAGEVFPLEHKSISGMISLVSASTVMFVVLKTFPNCIDAVGLYGVYWIYSIILGVNLFVLLNLLPETKGRILQDIEDEFKGHKLKLDNIEIKKCLQLSSDNVNKSEISKDTMSELR